MIDLSNYGMGKGALKPKDKKDAPSGMEIMLRNMGLAEVLDAAKTFASADTVQKIMEFSDALPALSLRIGAIGDALERIEQRQVELANKLGHSDADGLSAVAERNPEPGSGHGNGASPRRARKSASSAD